MTIRVSKHAADRYIDRVKSHYTQDQARKEIALLCENATPLDLDKYPWLERGEYRSYVELAPGIFAPLLASAQDDGDKVVMTLLTHGGYAEDYRSRKNKRNQSKRFRRSRKSPKTKSKYNRKLDDFDKGDY